MYLFFTNKRYQQIRNLVVEIAGERINEFDATYTGRSSFRRQTKQAIIATHGVSEKEMDYYFRKFEERCEALLSKEEFEKTQAIINSIDPGTHGGPHRVHRFHNRGAEKLAAAGYSVEQIVGAYGLHWQNMSRLERLRTPKAGPIESLRRFVEDMKYRFV